MKITDNNDYKKYIRRLKKSIEEDKKMLNDKDNNKLAEKQLKYNETSLKCFKEIFKNRKLDHSYFDELMFYGLELIDEGSSFSTEINGKIRDRVYKELGIVKHYATLDKKDEENEENKENITPSKPKEDNIDI